MKRLAIAAAAVGAIAPLTSPAYAAPSAIGFTCGFASTNDPTGVVDQDPNHQFGIVNVGPIIAIDLDDLTANVVVDGNGVEVTNVTAVCAINVNTASYNGPHATSNSFRGIGPIGGEPPLVIWFTWDAAQIDYTAGPTDNVYLCTTWILKTANSIDTTTVYYDEATGEFVTELDRASCPLAISAGA